MVYRLTHKAAEDLKSIYVYGAQQFGRARADSYYGAIVDVLEFLANFPRAARERMEFLPPVRIHPVGAHVVIYVIEGEGILVIRVLHGRQDWERYL